ncbi:ABC transporter substrate-binding protein [Rhodoplanes roseus]|nr:ABC transporter substrate-binding protein [Rhodoplanes roseus]
MDPVPITLACWDYDRTLPILRGLVPIEGCAVHGTVLTPQEAFVRAFTGAEFDVSELSLSRQAQAVARGTNAYVAIPAFPSRAFRHASLYVRADRGIAAPQDLRGRRIGLVNFDDTAAVVIRGLLEDVYGVARADVTWVVGDLDRPRRDGIAVPALSAAVPVEASAPGDTLDRQLVEGRIDGLIGLVPPPCFQARDPVVRRLFPDWAREERAYWAATGLFPVMHVVGIRRSLAEQHPWLPKSVFAAFAAAKDLAMADLAMLQAPKTSLPWLVAAYEDTRALMGDDFWAYGIEANRAVLAATLRHLRQDGLLARDLVVEELFPLPV